MFFYENTAASQERCHCFVTHTATVDTKISYQFANYLTTREPDLYTKLDRVLALLEGQRHDDPDELMGYMSTQEAADFLLISKRTFERKVKQRLISPIEKNTKKNQFSKRDVVQLFIAYRGYRPTHMP